MAEFLRAFRRGSGFFLLPEPGTAVSHTFFIRAHLESRGRADLRSAPAYVSAGGSGGGAKVRLQRARWKLKRSKLFFHDGVWSCFHPARRWIGEMPEVVCLKTTSLSPTTRQIQEFIRFPLSPQQRGRLRTYFTSFGACLMCFVLMLNRYN